MTRLPLPACCLPALLVACAATPTPTPPAVPDALKPPAGESLLAVVAARGVQIYECRPKKDDPAAAEWAFVAPEAQLYDAQGRKVGKHYAGPHWEALDGSKIVGTVKSRADAPVAGAIPWLLLTTKAAGGSGIYSKVTSIQRINTVGGVSPAGSCTPGATERVPYTADYVLFAAAS